MGAIATVLGNAWGREDAARVGRMLAIAAVISTVATVLVVVLTAAAPELAANGETPIELWAGCVALVLVGLAARGLERETLGATGLVTVASALVLVGIVRQVAHITWDYECFYQAGRRLRAGEDLYPWVGGDPSSPGTRYWYSPLLAVVFGALERLPDGQLDSPVFLTWTAAGFWAAAAFVPLLMTALRRVYGWSLVPAAAAALALGVASTPVLRTLQYSQPNLIVADGLLGWLLLSRRRERTASLLLASTALLKTSPAIMLLLLAWDRRWRALGWTMGWAAGIVAATTAVIGWRPWARFTAALAAVRSDGFYRDNSFESLLRSTGRVMGVDEPGVAHVGGTVIALVVVGTLFAVARRRSLPWSSSMPAPAGRTEAVFPVALLAMVLLSPVVWEHHWVWTSVPCALLAAGHTSRTRALLALFGGSLIFFIPTFDLYPLSFHRLAGAMLLVLTMLSGPRSKAS